MSGASKLMRSGGVGENLEFGWNDEMWLGKTIRMPGEGEESWIVVQRGGREKDCM